MALNIGVPLPAGSGTTLGQLLDAVFSDRSPTLGSASATYTPSDGNVLVVSWPAVGDDAVYIRLVARPTTPEWIGLGVVEMEPTLASVNPATVVHGAAATSVALSGTNFVSGAVASASGSALVTTFIDSGDLSATIPAAQLAAAGTLSITVQNPDGQSTGEVMFTVT